MIQFFSYLAATVLSSLPYSVHFWSKIVECAPKTIKIGLNKKVNPRPRPDFEYTPKTIKIGLNKKVNPRPWPDFFDGD